MMVFPRSSALGMFMCGGHIGALIAVPLYAALPMAVSKYAASLTAAALVVPTVSSLMLRDPCALL